MHSNVLVTIRGTQSDGTEQDTIETISHGQYRFLTDKHAVSFEELLPSEANTTISIKNILKITDETVTLTKRGVTQTEMFFQQGHTFCGFYQTPFGTFDMALHTSRLKITSQDDLLRAEIDYALELNGQHVSDCSIQISVTSNN